MLIEGVEEVSKSAKALKILASIVAGFISDKLENNDEFSD